MTDSVGLLQSEIESVGRMAQLFRLGVAAVGIYVRAF